jgi:hypothetical protein
MVGIQLGEILSVPLYLFLLFKSNMKPLILVLDMDGTFIGDTIYQICHYDICKSLRAKINTADLQSHLQNGLVRPYFESFFKTVKLTYPNMEIFVYTASEKVWANFIITNIEKTLNIKFNRPIFSREYCTLQNKQYYKSIAKIKPLIYKKVKKQYMLQSITSLDKRILFIDNTSCLLPNEKVYFLKCPTYNVAYPIDVLGYIPHKTLIKHQDLIASILKKYNVNVSSEGNFWASYYYILSVLFKSSPLMSGKSAKEIDQFWLHCERVFKTYHIKSFNSKLIAYLKNKAT